MIAAVMYGESTIKESLSFSFLLKLVRTYDMRFLRWVWRIKPCFHLRQCMRCWATAH